MNTNKTEYLDLDKLSAYGVAYSLSNYVWEIIIQWKYFQKDTVGKQFVRSVDSISANIAEGFGRYGKKDKIKFYRYSLGSQKESIDWCKKCFHRELINSNQHNHILKELNKLPREIYSLINYTNQKLQT